MNITKAEKIMNGAKVISENSIRCVINGIECWVPEVMDNKDYAELKKQEREGKVVIEERQV